MGPDCTRKCDPQRPQRGGEARELPTWTNADSRAVKVTGPPSLSFSDGNTTLLTSRTMSDELRLPGVHWGKRFKSTAGYKRANGVCMSCGEAVALFSRHVNQAAAAVAAIVPCSCDAELSSTWHRPALACLSPDRVYRVKSGPELAGTLTAWTRSLRWRIDFRFELRPRSSTNEFPMCTAGG